MSQKKKPKRKNKLAILLNVRFLIKIYMYLRLLEKRDAVDSAALNAGALPKEKE